MERLNDQLLPGSSLCVSAIAQIARFHHRRRSDPGADLRPSSAAAEAALHNISPGYFDAAGTALLTGRSFSWHDDKNSPHVAVVNREFARKICGSVSNALAGLLQDAVWIAHTSGGHCSRRRKIWEPRRRSKAGDVSAR